MTVERNVGYGLRVLKIDASEVVERVGQALKMVNLDGYQKRHPDELSGGQQQRVAVARAMVLKPKVLLFDEPLSNIDSKLRRSMREDIRMLQKSSGITSVYVTHDQAEALAVSDEVIVINEGKIEQQGPPKSLYHLPQTAFVANFIGESNVIDATLEKEAAERQLAAVDLAVPGRAAVQQIVHIKSESQSDTAIEGIVSQSAYMGSVIEYSINTKVGSLFTRAPAYHEQYQPNDKVYLHVNPEELIVIPTAGENKEYLKSIV